VSLIDLAPKQTHGLVCAHNHFYSALARGMLAQQRVDGLAPVVSGHNLLDVARFGGVRMTS